MPDKAIAALASLLVEKGLLQRMRALGAAQTFDGGDLFPSDAPNRFGATFLRYAVDQHHAAAALLEPTAEARAHEAKFVAQHVKQRRLLVIERNADGFAID